MADIVVAVDQDHGPVGSQHATAGRAGIGDQPFDLDQCLQERFGFDADEHGTVAQPLRNANPVGRCNTANDRTERRQNVDRLIVPAHRCTG